MKNYDEVTNDLLERRDRYVVEQKKKKKESDGRCHISVLFLSCGITQLWYVARWNFGHYTTPSKGSAKRY